MADAEHGVSKRRFSSVKHHEHKFEDPRLEKCKSADLDEIIGFSAARQRALEKNAMVDYQQPLKSFFENRVFINHVDSFNGKVLADYLSEQTIGVARQDLLAEDEEDEFADEEPNLLNLSEEEGEEAAKDKASKKSKSRQSFEILGTVDFMKNPNYLRPESVHEILDEEHKSEFLSKVLTCGYIIYDISSTLNCHPIQIEEASWVLTSIVNQLEDIQKYAPKMFKKYKDCRTFILISTVMTWAKTRPIDPEDPTLPFTERDFRKRKPHPNYKVHCDFEKKVLELGKRFPDNLKTVVIASGVTYGLDEDVLHFLFKMAWLNGTDLPLFRPGNNKIPLIHVNALANIVHLVMEDYPERVKYILAVEQATISLKKIVKLISTKLGNGRYVKVNKEEAFTYPEIKQRNYDMLTVNLNIVPGYIVNHMELTFGSELTFKENIDAVIAEFRASRNLTPIRIFIHGPPACGKTLLSRKLASYYQIHHLHAQRVIEEGIDDIKFRIAEFKDRGKGRRAGDAAYGDGDEDEDADEGDDDDDDDDEGEGNDELREIDAASQLLREIEDNMASNERNRLDEQYVLRLFKRKMLSNPCQNQGFVIDGYPKTMDDTRTLYEPDEDADDVIDIDEEEESKQDLSRFYNKKIMPTYIVSLDASDDFLIERVIKMPQSVVENSHYVEEEMCRRLTEYRANNTEENTPLIFYDELEVHPLIYNIEAEVGDTDMQFIFEDIVREIGLPRNYDSNTNYVDEILQARERMKAKNLEDLKLKSRQILQERREKMENWMFLKNEEKEMEEKALALLTMPVRHYLMKYIFPTLTRGLVEVARVRPDDPVDYLAEFLFKENPEGKMFQPNYDVLEEELAAAMKEYEISVDSQDQDFEKRASKAYSMDESAAADAVSNVTDVKEKCSEASVSVKASPPPEAAPKKSRPPESRDEEVSSGSCKCVKSRRSSSSTSSTPTPPLPPSVCTCPPYPRTATSTSSSSTTGSDKSSSQSQDAGGSGVCRCGAK